MSSGERVESGSVSQTQQPAIGTSQRLTDLGKRRTYIGMAWRRFRRNKLAMLGLAVMLLMVLFALSAGLIAEYVTGFALSDQNLMNAYQPIGAENHLLGTDDVGRDTLTRLAYGARVSLGVAGLAVVGALTIGVMVGLMAGYYGRWVDSILMRFVDIMLSIPTLFLLLLVATMFDLGLLSLAGLIAAVAWVTLSRLIRGEVISVKNRDYVDAARVVGATDRRVIFRHILPNVLPVMIVWASLTVPALILTEASLSYLGLGIQPPEPSWGNMLSNAQRVWSRSITMVILPGLAIYITVFAINLMGNGLRDALDPRLTD
jgi:peptide/nickel transport system permease protein